MIRGSILPFPSPFSHFSLLRAFARAYAPAILSPHLPALAEALLATALFDRETNVRRAASAALQGGPELRARCAMKNGP